MSTASSPVSRKVTAEAGLEAPDGRPLHGYPLSAGLIAELEGTLRSRLGPGSGQALHAGGVCAVGRRAYSVEISRRPADLGICF